jgi:DNA repair protein RadD
MDNPEIARFFAETAVNIWHNACLREPQIDGYFAVRDHFSQSGEPCYVQLPVGCGKTGLMGLTPFGIAKGRVLIIAPKQGVERQTAAGSALHCRYGAEQARPAASRP